VPNANGFGGPPATAYTLMKECLKLVESHPFELSPKIPDEVPE